MLPTVKTAFAPSAPPDDLAHEQAEAEEHGDRDEAQQVEAACVAQTLDVEGAPERLVGRVGARGAQRISCGT
jgi:hypothetical protein